MPTLNALDEARVEDGAPTSVALQAVGLSTSLRSGRDDRFVALADRFLAMMRDERGASEHTLRAYRREVGGIRCVSCPRCLATHGDVRAVEHTHIRSYLLVLYERGLTKTSCGAGAGSDSELVQVDGKVEAWSMQIRHCW